MTAPPNNAPVDAASATNDLADELRPLAAIAPALVCEALAPLLLDGRRERIDAVVAARLGGLRILIENLHDPHNGAAVLRSAESFGIQRVHVVEAIEPFRFSSAVTQGCEKWLDIIRHADFASAAATLRAEGVALYAAVPDAKTPLAALDFSRPAALMVGNEHAGLSALAQKEADVCFSIPMTGMTRSLNLSVATAICAEHAAWERRKTFRDGRLGDLPDDVALALRARFYAGSIRGASDVVERFLRGRKGRG